MINNEDIHFYLLTLMDDASLENLSYTNHYWHELTKNIWFYKCQNQYLVPSCGLKNFEYKSLYFKMKYNQWNHIVQWVDVHQNKLLMDYIYNNEYYAKWLNEMIKNTVTNHNQLCKTTILIKYYNLYFTHFYYINKASYKKQEWMINKNNMLSSFDYFVHNTFLYQMIQIYQEFFLNYV
jgi:hypothetical protein